MKSLHAKAAKSTFVTSEKNAYLSLSLYTSLWKIENKIHNNILFLLLGSETYSIPGGPEITEQSIQWIFQDFALINSYFFHPAR